MVILKLTHVSHIASRLKQNNILVTFKTVYFSYNIKSLQHFKFLAVLFALALFLQMFAKIHITKFPGPKFKSQCLSFTCSAIKFDNETFQLAH